MMCNRSFTFNFLLFLTLFVSCEKSDDINRNQADEFITFTINDDYTYNIEILENVDNDCDFLVSLNQNLSFFNSTCETHNNSEIFITINNFENTQNIPIDLNGSFATNEPEAIIGFRIPYPNSSNINELRLFQMFNGTVDILNSGDIDEYIDFEFFGEAFFAGLNGVEFVSVIGTAHILRDE